MALGAKIVPGFDLVADMTGLAERVARADLVATGEGHLDPPSFKGKVPGGVLSMAASHCPVLCIVGAADAEILRSSRPTFEIVSLADRFGGLAARQKTCELIGEVTLEALSHFRN